MNQDQPCYCDTTARKGLLSCVFATCVHLWVSHLLQSIANDQKAFAGQDLLLHSH